MHSFSHYFSQAKIEKDKGFLKDGNLVIHSLEPDLYATSAEVASDSTDDDVFQYSGMEDWDKEISLLQTKEVADLCVKKPFSWTSIKSEERMQEHHICTDSSQSIKIDGPKTSIFSSNNAIFDDVYQPVTEEVVPHETNTSQEYLSYKEEYNGKNVSVSHTICQVHQEPHLQHRDYNAPLQEDYQLENQYFGNCGTDTQPDSGDLTFTLPQGIQNVSEWPDANEDLYDWSFMEKLNNLETVFSLPDKEMFLTLLKETLQLVTSPYSFLLYLVENHYSKVTEGKNSMAHIALSQFQKWHNEEPFSKLSPNKMERDHALWIVTTHKLYLFDLCNKVFKLDSKGNEFLQRHIYYLLKNKRKYKEVSCGSLEELGLSKINNFSTRKVSDSNALTCSVKVIFPSFKSGIVIILY